MCSYVTKDVSIHVLLPNVCRTIKGNTKGREDIQLSDRKSTHSLQVQVLVQLHLQIKMSPCIVMGIVAQPGVESHIDMTASSRSCPSVQASLHCDRGNSPCQSLLGYQILHPQAIWCEGERAG